MKLLPLLLVSVGFLTTAGVPTLASGAPQTQATPPRVMNAHEVWQDLVTRVGTFWKSQRNASTPASASDASTASTLPRELTANVAEFWKPKPTQSVLNSPVQPISAVSTPSAPPVVAVPPVQPATPPQPPTATRVATAVPAHPAPAIVSPTPPPAPPPMVPPTTPINVVVAPVPAPAPPPVAPATPPVATEVKPSAIVTPPLPPTVLTQAVAQTQVTLSTTSEKHRRWLTAPSAALPPLSETATPLAPLRLEVQRISKKKDASDGTPPDYTYGTRSTYRESLALHITLQNLSPQPVTNVVVRWAIVKTPVGRNPLAKDTFFGGQETLAFKPTEEKTIETPAVEAGGSKSGTMGRTSGEMIKGHGVQVLIGTNLVTEEIMPPAIKISFKHLQPVPKPPVD